MANVIFKTGTRTQYDALATKDINTLYWLTDTQELFKGEVLFGKGADAAAQASGLMSAEDKAKLDQLSSSGILNLSATDASVVISDVEGGKSIGVGISADEGNQLSLHSDGLFVSGGTVEADIEALQNSVNILNGTGEGSVKKTAEDAAAAAIEDLTTKVSDDGVVNTVKELVDYVAEHAPETADMAADISDVQSIINSLPDEFLSEITSVSRTETTNVAEIRLSIKQADGTYSTSQEHGVLTLISAGQGVDGVSGAGLMSLADKQKLDSIVVSDIEDLKQSILWGEI